MAPSPTQDNVKLALALAIVKARANQVAAVQHWKKKAKAHKKELQDLERELQLIQDDKASSAIEVLPAFASCKCTFFANMGQTLESKITDARQDDINQLLFRRFIRTVTQWEYSKGHKNHVRSSNSPDRVALVSICIEFLIDIIDKSSLAPTYDHMAAYGHQAIDLIKDTVSHILEDDLTHEKLIINKIMASLASEVVDKMLIYSKAFQDMNNQGMDIRSWISQILSAIGVIPFIGQRVLIVSSEKMCVALEHMMLMDPFSQTNSRMYDNATFLLQLIETLILHHSTHWASHDSFDEVLLKEWIQCFINMKKTCAIFSEFNSLFAMYMERLTGHMVKQLHRLSNMDKIYEQCHECIVAFVNCGK